MVTDWKSGTAPVTAPEDNLQLGFLAPCAARAFGKGRAVVRIVYVNGGGGLTASDAELSPGDLGEMEERTRTIPYHSPHGGGSRGRRGRAAIDRRGPIHTHRDSRGGPAGVDVLTCTTLGDNYRLLSVVHRAFPGSPTSYAGGACSIRVPLTSSVAPPATEEAGNGGTSG